MREWSACQLGRGGGWGGGGSRIISVECMPIGQEKLDIQRSGLGYKNANLLILCSQFVLFNAPPPPFFFLGGGGDNL